MTDWAFGTLNESASDQSEFTIVASDATAGAAIYIRIVLRFLPPILAASHCAAQPLRGPIVAIDYYGAASIDFTRLRAVYLFQTGDIFELGKATDIDRPTDEFQKLIDKCRHSVAPVFIPDLNGFVLYVDVEPPDTSPVNWNPEPTGTDKLPERVVVLCEHAIGRMLSGAIFAGDETTNGYSLSKDPVMREDELKLIQYARGHANRVYSVLTRSSSSRHRIAAAWTAGYAPKGTEQLKARLQSVMDPDPTVRNNAMRVLAVVASNDAKIAR